MSSVPMMMSVDMAIPGDAGATMEWSKTVCGDNYLCCSGSNQDSCHNTRCCITIKCDHPGANVLSHKIAHAGVERYDSAS
jgi:hypothetical protein